MTKASFNEANISIHITGVLCKFFFCLSQNDLWLTLRSFIFCSLIVKVVILHYRLCICKWDLVNQLIMMFEFYGDRLLMFH